jgi:alanine racemase
MARDTIAVLSTDNLLHNLKKIQQQAPNCKVIAMTKANAYGHGLRSTSLRLDGHVASLGVAYIDEAIALRQAGVKCPITLMEGVFNVGEYLVAACENFHVVLRDYEQLQWLSGSQLPKPIYVWLKVDTGMNRLGFPYEATIEIYNKLRKLPHLVKDIGLMSHLACADVAEHPHNTMQIDLFKGICQNIVGEKSLCNSAAIYNFSQHLYDVVRPGLALYGASPVVGKSAAELGLKPVMTLQTRLMTIRHAKAGSYIGYGARYQCQQDMKLGIISIGYGDGYSRTFRDGTPILVNGKRCSLVGKVAMDMTTIDLSNCPEAKPGDLVVLWGDGLPIDEVASYSSCSAYDLFCSIQNRVKFHWTRD